MTALYITTVESEKYIFSIFTLTQSFQIFQNFQLLTPIYKLFLFPTIIDTSDQFENDWSNHMSKLLNQISTFKCIFLSCKILQ